MEFKLKIALDNAAFEDPSELSRILREVADKIDGTDLRGDMDAFDRKVRCMDVNGNTVGFAQIGGKR